MFLIVFRLREEQFEKGFMELVSLYGFWISLCVLDWTGLVIYKSDWFMWIYIYIYI